MKKFSDRQHDQATIQEVLTGNTGFASMLADLHV